MMIELLTTGKTKEKVNGFTSKAGNVFDAFLKFENDTISFDFDRVEEAAQNETSATNEQKEITQNEEKTESDVKSDASMEELVETKEDTTDVKE